MDPPPLHTMLRRSHKKSRNGCLACKKRHQKCDEGQPSCRNCTSSYRTCVYQPTKTSQPAADHLKHVQTGGRSTLTTLNSRSDQLSSTPPASTPSSQNTVTSDNEYPGNDTLLVNMDHMKMLRHVSMKILDPSMDDEYAVLSTGILLDAAANEPFLMHEVLAFSARHLAATSTSKSESVHYHEQSLRLQNKAIQLFASSQGHLDESKCTSTLLFTSLLGHHLLADTITRRRPTLDAFLNDYTKYVQVHRGVRDVSAEIWHIVKDGVIKPLMAWIDDLNYHDPIGHEFDSLISFVSSSSGLGKESVESCVTAIRYLQSGYDAASRPKPRHQIAFIWSILCDKGFNELVIRKQPEALLIFAHYAGLLHFARDYWHVENSGEFLIRLISEYLGSEWQQHLVWPLSLLPTHD